MPIIEESVAYPPIQDHIWWLADSKPRSQMTPEELAALRARVRANYTRMRDRMAVDPVYREARLAVARRGAKKWREKNRDNPTYRAARRAQDSKYRERFKDQINARVRAAYVGERAETIRAQNRDWYARNREKRKEYRKTYRLANGDRLRERERERARIDYAPDPQRVNDYQKAWRAKNRTKARLYVQVSGHKRRGAPGEFSILQWEALVRVYDFRCGYCGRVAPLEADHRVPVIRGGANTIDNIIPACRPCNRRKHQKTEAEFRELLERRPATGCSTAVALLPVPAGSAPVE